MEKKRLGLESFFYRMRKKLKQKQEAEGAAASVSDGPKAADESAPVVAAMPTVPPTANTAPTPTTTGIETTSTTHQELENIPASRAFNEAIESGSPFKIATEEAAAAAAAARANQNLPAATVDTKSLHT